VLKFFSTTVVSAMNGRLCAAELVYGGTSAHSLSVSAYYVLCRNFQLHMCRNAAENVLPSHHSQFYSHSLPCSMAPILCSVWPHGGTGMECGMWHVECGVWHVATCSAWKVECGNGKVESGKWKVECGMWNVECGMWNVEC
jgi:hypothetical protein